MSNGKIAVSGMTNISGYYKHFLAMFSPDGQEEFTRFFDQPADSVFLGGDMVENNAGGVTILSTGKIYTSSPWLSRALLIKTNSQGFPGSLVP